MTPAQISLAWLLTQHPGVVPIPGTTKVAHLEENVAAAEVALTPDEMNALGEAAPAGAAAGERYDERGMASVNG